MEAIRPSAAGPGMLLFPNLLSLGEEMHSGRCMAQMLDQDCICLDKHVQLHITFSFRWPLKKIGRTLNKLINDAE